MTQSQPSVSLPPGHRRVCPTSQSASNRASVGPWHLVKTTSPSVIDLNGGASLTVSFPVMAPLTDISHQ